MYKKLLIIFSLLSVSLNAITLDELVQKALLNNNNLKRIAIDVKQSKKARESIKAQNFGRVDFVASYDHYNNARTLAPLTPMNIVSDSPSSTNAYEIPSTKDLFSGGLAYNVILFDGYAQQNAYKISDIAYNNSILKTKLAKEELIYNVKSIYVSLLALEEQLKSQRTYTKSQNNLYKKVQAEYELGSKSKLDLLKAKNSHQESQSNEDKLLANIEILNSTLSMLIGGEAVSDVEKIEINMEKNLDNDSSLSNLNRLKLAKLQNNMAIKKIEKASSPYYPVVDFSAYYGYTFGPNATQNTFPSTGEVIIDKDDFNDENIWQLGVHLKWNIYDFGAKSSYLEKEKLSLISSRLEENDVRLELEKNVKISKSKLKLARADFQSSQTQYELLFEIVKAQDIKYDADAITIDDLLDSKAKANLAYSKMISSKYEFLKAKYYIDYLYEKGEKE